MALQYSNKSHEDVLNRTTLQDLVGLTATYLVKKIPRYRYLPTATTSQQHQQQRFEILSFPTSARPSSLLHPRQYLSSDALRRPLLCKAQSPPTNSSSPPTFHHECNVLLLFRSLVRPLVRPLSRAARPRKSFRTEETTPRPSRKSSQRR